MNMNRETSNILEQNSLKKETSAILLSLNSKLSYQDAKLVAELKNWKHLLTGIQ